VAVVIRMKQMGRAHRHYYRIVAIDKRQPRDGKVIEELGTYDPSVKETDQRVTLVPSRIKYWQSVGAKPSDQVLVLMTKYMKTWEEKEAAELAKAAAAKAAAPAN
jgi:small subunit ribosomal protein S16